MSISIPPDEMRRIANRLATHNDQIARNVLDILEEIPDELTVPQWDARADDLEFLRNRFHDSTPSAQIALISNLFQQMHQYRLDFPNDNTNALTSEEIFEQVDNYSLDSSSLESFPDCDSLPSLDK